MEIAEGSKGLSSPDAARRLQEHGPNTLRQEKKASAWSELAAQFKGPLILLLLGACVLSAVLGEIADAVAIGTILVVNALVGFFLERRTGRALDALRSMAAPHARVLRDGRTVDVATAEIVVGDLLVLDAGDLVSADARLLEANVLRMNEASLTGESAPVEKSATPTAEGAALAEKHDRVFAGTAVVTGTGTAEVISTGMATELGKIAGLLETAEEGPTPLQKRLEHVAKTLLLLCVGIVAVVALLGFLRGEGWLNLLMTSVSLAVAAVPEGLPAIVTVALALGVQRMAKRHALVRKLPSVETLGCATIICSDKTGTLTTGIMAVRELWGADQQATLDAAVASSDAELDEAGGGTGDPTEVALLLAGAERGIARATIERERARVEVHPFDAERKRMSILRADGTLYVKGAVELLLPLCTTGVEGASEANTEMAGRGLRVLGVAVGTGPREEGLRLLGLVGMADPPRAEAIEAIRQARAAGIRTVMITGDHPVTALAIARELGILGKDDDPAELVHARATPEDKLRIVREWKAKGAIVAMTGDGVNDAPALREANIGVAMGKTGTDVAREAADMVLTDDNFASIVAAIREGRGIYDNIRKTLLYLLSGNLAELCVMLGASIVGLPLPLLPLHLLWINLVTDGMPALALAMDPPEADVLDRAPRSPDEPILGRSQWTYIAMVGALDTAVTLGVFAWALKSRNLTEARNLAFSVLVFSEVLRSLATRSQVKTFWELGALTNVFLFGIAAISVLLQLAIHHIPATQALFHLGPLSLTDCALSLEIGMIPVTILELSKLVRRAGRPKQSGGAAISRHSPA